MHNRHKNFVELPIKPHLYKWLINVYSYKEALEINTFLLPQRCANPLLVYSHYLNERNWPTIRVIGYYASKSNVYTLHRMLEDRFSFELLAYTKAMVYAGMPARTAIKRYLNKCRIGEGELALATAYKQWQRGQNSFSRSIIIT